MPDLRALIIDSDESFRTLVGETLGNRFDRIESVSPQEFSLEDVTRLQADLVFVAVELPDRLGFRHISSIRRADRHARVVLCTSTLSPAECALHGKLKAHADLYVDKRTTGAAELANGLATLKLPGRARRPVEDLPRRDGRPGVWITDLLEDGADPEAALVLESLGLGTERGLQELLVAGKPRGTDESAAGSPPSAARQDAKPGSSPDDELSRTRAALQEARLEVEQAREAARSSPFARSYLELQEAVQHAAQERTELRRRLSVAQDASAALRGALSRVAKELSLERRFRQTDAQQRGELQSRLAAQAEDAHTAVDKIAALERVLGEQRMLVTEVTRDRDAAQREATGLRSKLEHERRSHDSARQAVERELAALRTSHAEQLERLAGEKRAELDRLEKALREQAKADLEASEDGWRLDLARREAELGARVSMWQRQVQTDAEKLAHVERLLAQERAATASASQERDSARQQAIVLREAHEREAEALRAAHAAECERIASEHRDLLERREKELRDEFAKRLEAQEARLGEQLAQSEADFEARTAAQEAELSAVRTESETLAEQIRSDAAESVERAVAEVAELHRARVDELAADRDRLTSLAKEQEDELTALHLELRERDSELATLRTELEERESAVASLKLMLDDVYRGDQADETDDDAE